MNDIIKIATSLEEFSLLVKGVNETIQNKAKKQKGGFLSMLLSTLGVSLLGKLLKEVNELKGQQYLDKEWWEQVTEQVVLLRIFNATLSFNKIWNNLSRIRDRAYVINLHEYESIGTHWIALYVNGNNIIYFDNFRFARISKEIKTFIGNKNIITNIHRTQAYASIMCEWILLYWIYWFYVKR